MHQHGPYESPAGGRPHRARRFLALAAGLTLAGAVFAACGGDEDGEDGGAQATPTLRPSTIRLPDLSDLGYKQIEKGRDPIVPKDIDMARALYDRSTDVERRAIVQMYVLDAEGTALQHYDQIVAAYKTMPAAILMQNPLAAGNPTGQPPINKETDGPSLGDKHQSFVTNKPDNKGSNVWTDVYRDGRVVVAIQVLEKDVAMATQTREAIAKRVVSER